MGQNLQHKITLMNSISPRLIFVIFFITSFVQASDKPAPTVFGVRWALGDKFAYSSPKTQTNEPTTQNYYILSFNSDEAIKVDVLVEVEKSTYACSGRQLLVDLSNYENGLTVEENGLSPNDNETETVIYKCFINQDLYGKEAVYSIISIEPIFMKDQNPNYKNGNITVIDREVKQNRVVLFQGKFRAPPSQISSQYSNNLKFFVLGDWGLKEIPDQPKSIYYKIQPSMLNLLNKDENITLAVFMGDLAYDFVGQNYFLMLQKMQPITSRICFMVTPGNHDYVYHQESFQLFAESFFSPRWDKGFDFYYNFIVGNVMFIQYTPSDLIYEDSYKTNINPIGIMKEEFSQADIEYIHEHYHLVVFNHYPIHCSAEKQRDGTSSCSQNRGRLEQYLKIFTQMGLDLYLAGHVHAYERVHEVCFNGTIIQPSKNQEGVDVYGTMCPIYITEGAAGYSFGLSTEYQAQPGSAALVFGPGYGVASFTNDQQNNNSIFYQHYSVKEDTTAFVADKWMRDLDPIEQSSQSQSLNYMGKLEVMGVLALMGLIGGICFCLRYGLKKKDARPKKSDHVQMIEQQFQTVALSDRLDQNQNSKSSEHDSRN